jgi:hypothetical protein
MEKILEIRTHDIHNNFLLVKESSKEFKINYGKYNFWKHLSTVGLFEKPNFNSTSDWYSVNKIIELSLIETEITKNKSNLGKILATGLLFGPVGAIAGSLGNNQKSNSKTLYSVRFTLNDIKLSVVDLHCNDIETALRVINTVKLLKYNNKKIIKLKRIKSNY